MKRILLVAACLVLGGLGASLGQLLTRPQPVQGRALDARNEAAVAKEPTSYRDVVKKVLPAVVSIEAFSKDGKPKRRAEDMQFNKPGGDDDNPLYYGRAVGKWAGQTLEVDTRGFNEDFWFTNGGVPHTDKLRLLERFTRTDFDTLKYEVTVDDAGAYTRPWSTGWELRWVGGADLPVHFCQDNRP